MFWARRDKVTVWLPRWALFKRIVWRDRFFLCWTFTGLHWEPSDELQESLRNSTPLRGRFGIDSTSRFDIDFPIDPISMPNRLLRREGEADSRVGSGGRVPNKPL